MALSDRILGRLKLVGRSVRRKLSYARSANAATRVLSEGRATGLCRSQNLQIDVVCCRARAPPDPGAPALECVQLAQRPVREHQSVS